MALRASLSWSLPLVALAVASSVVPVAAQTVSMHTGGKQLRIEVGEAARLPADFPLDIALPQPNVLTRVQRSDTTTVLELDAAGDVGAVATQLDASMQAAGWARARIAQPAAGTAQAWEKDARAVITWLTPGDAGVHLQLQLRPRR